MAALQILLATSTIKNVIIPEDDAKLNDQASCLRGLESGSVIEYTDTFYIFFHFYEILKMFHPVANTSNIEIK